MNSPIFVVEGDTGQLENLRGRAMVACARSLEEAQRIGEAAANHEISVHCMVVRAKGPLALLPLRAELLPWPLALFAPSLGRFQDLVRLLPVLRQLNVRIYMPATREEGVLAARILASLGIDSALDFDGPGKILWEQLADLMTYALLGLAPHADIEPFAFLAANYDPEQRASFGAVYFDDPDTYLHLDASGRVALTKSDLRQGKFFAQSLQAVTDEDRLAAWETNHESWRDFFLTRSRCAQCPGWRLCAGAFCGREEEGCSSFFHELMEVIEKRRDARSKVKTPWRP